MYKIIYLDIEEKKLFEYDGKNKNVLDSYEGYLPPERLRIYDFNDQLFLNDEQLGYVQRPSPNCIFKIDLGFNKHQGHGPKFIELYKRLLRKEGYTEIEIIDITPDDDVLAFCRKIGARVWLREDSIYYDGELPLYNYVVLFFFRLKKRLKEALKLSR